MTAIGIALTNPSAVVAALLGTRTELHHALDRPTKACDKRTCQQARMHQKLFALLQHAWF
jgi:hypothetical protein